MHTIDGANHVGVEAELAYRRQSLNASYPKATRTRNPVRRALRRASERLHLG